MASGWYQQGLFKIANGTIDVDTSTLKVMLVKSTYTYDPDHDFLDDLSEISGVSGYTSGYGNAGRKTATVTLQTNNTSNRLDIAIADLTWTALAAGDTIGGAVLIFETGGSDATGIPIAFFDLTDTPTNGSDITLDFTALASGGNLRIAA